MLDRQCWLQCQTEDVCPGLLCKISSPVTVSSPEGAICLISKSGSFQGVWEPGLHFCLPWTEITYMVSTQNFVYDLNVSSCPTSDNIFITLHCSVVLSMIQEHDYLYNLCLNVNDLNQMLDAAIQERVRVLARSVESRKAYSLTG